jgi:biotin operon repressor
MTISAPPPPMMGTYERRVLALLQDGEPHAEEELYAVAHYPREWVRALREDGYRIEERNGIYRLI